MPSFSKKYDGGAMELRMLFHAFMNNCLLFYSLKSSLWPHMREFLELISLKAIDISVSPYW